MLRRLRLLPPGQTTCYSLADLQWTCRRTQVRGVFGLICPPVSASFFPDVSDCSTVELLGHWPSNILDQPIPIQVTAFCRLSSRAFLELGTPQHVAPRLSSALKKGLRVSPKRQIVVDGCSTEPAAVPLRIITVNCKKEEVSLSPLRQEIIPQHRVFWKGFSALMLAIKAEIRSPP